MTHLSKLKSASVRIRGGIGYAVDERTMIRVYEPLPGIPDCTVPSEMLFRVLKSAPEDRVFTVSGDRLIVRATRFSASIPFSRHEPTETPVVDAEEFTADIGQAMQIAKRAITPGDNQERPFMDFVYCSGNVATGTNGRMCARVALPASVPAFELDESLIPDSGPVIYRVSDKSIETRVGQVSIVSQRPADRWDVVKMVGQVIPKTGFVAEFTIDAEEFKRAVETCAVAHENVSIDVGPRVVFEASKDSEASYEPAASGVSGSAKYLYQAKYLLRAASAMSGSVRVRLIDTHAALLESKGVEFVVCGLRKQ